MNRKLDESIHPTSSVLDRIRYSVEQKAEVYAMLEAILDRLDELQRAPDPWEESCLVLALNFLDSGLYARAHKELIDCVLPPGDRPSWREQQAINNSRGYSMVRLRMRLDGAKAANKQ